MTDLNRRSFLMSAAAIGATLAPSLQGLVAYGAGAQAQIGLRPTAGTGDGGYGPLIPAGPELALPEGFQYAMLGVEGTRMSDGNPTPRAHDGMAAFPMANGNVRLVRNHENRTPAGRASAHSSPELAYDVRGGGGTTSLEIAVRPDGSRELVRDFLSLTGTVYNCAGGPTPRGTWLTCEEATIGPTQGWQQKHGYVFEVDASAEELRRSEPLRGMGRFTHEAVAVDPATGFVYQTEDRQTAGFYRFIPDVPDDLARGGRLQMLAIDNRPHYLTPNGQTVGRPLPAVWVDIDDPDPESAEMNPLTVFAEGYGKGGALFSRLEGCLYADGTIYFDATDGGNAGAGQIWQYRPLTEERGELTLIYESPSELILKSPDNLTMSPRGGLVICEDNAAPFVRGLTRDGLIFDIAQNIITDREFAGACFSPDGQTLFFNIQGDTADQGPGNLGMTFAVWGPWERGAL